RQLMGDTPTFRDDERYLPLQAADLYAWWILKWHREGDSTGVEKLNFPWGANRKINRLHTEYKDDDIRQLLKDAVAKMPIVVKSMSYFRNPQKILRLLKARDNGIKMTLPDPSSRWHF